MGELTLKNILKYKEEIYGSNYLSQTDVQKMLNSPYSEKEK